jgi:hypothetical protein
VKLPTGGRLVTEPAREPLGIAPMRPT